MTNVSSNNNEYTKNDTDTAASIDKNWLPSNDTEYINLYDG